jgi:hypothetical protein
MQVAECTLSGPSVEDWCESVDSISMTEQLQGIGAIFENVEARHDYELLG